MKMKKVLPLFMAAMMLLPTTTMMSSCSDDDDDEEKIENPQDNSENEKDSTDINNPQIPQEVLKKVKEIYSKATIGPQKVTTVNQLAILTSICATRKGDGPITVTSSTLNGEEITLVTLGGTEMVEGQATSMEESQLAAFGKPNDYLTAVTKLFADGTIPQNKPVIVTGISLGGMIAQQILGVKEVTDNFNIRAIITFGSPITLPLDRKGIKVVRFADANDKVPQLGESILRSGALTSSIMTKEELNEILNNLDKTERISYTSKYTGMIETHALSYIEDECWSATDFLGDPNKSNILELKETMKFYHAPKLKK